MPTASTNDPREKAELAHAISVRYLRRMENLGHHRRSDLFYLLSRQYAGRVHHLLRTRAHSETKWMRRFLRVVFGVNRWQE